MPIRSFRGLLDVDPVYVPVREDAVWRLDHCPDCGYSLTGLADGGICPECGGAYDCSRVVLHGYATGSRSRVSNSTALAVWLRVLASMLPLGYFYFVWQPWRYRWLTIGGSVVVSLIVLHFLLDLAVRLSNGRPWLVRLDFSPRGCCQTDDFDPWSGVHALATLAREIMLPLLAAVALGWWAASGGRVLVHGIAAAAALGVAVVKAILWRGRRIIAVQAARDPTLQRQTWTPWTQVRRVHLDPAGGADGCELRIMTRVGKTDAPTDVVCHAVVRLPPDQVDALVGLILSWNASIRVTTTRRHRGAGAAVAVP